MALTEPAELDSEPQVLDWCSNSPAVKPGEGPPGSVGKREIRSMISEDDDRLRLNHCPECGYDLRGLPGTHSCPECGFEYHETMFSLVAATSRQSLGLWDYLPWFATVGVLILTVGTQLLYRPRLGTVFFVPVVALPFAVTFVGTSLLVLYLKRRQRKRTGGGDLLLLFSSEGVSFKAGNRRRQHYPWRRIARFSMRQASPWRDGGLWRFVLRGSTTGLLWRLKFVRRWMSFSPASVIVFAALSRRDAASVERAIRKWIILSR